MGARARRRGKFQISGYHDDFARGARHQVIVLGVVHYFRADHCKYRPNHFVLDALPRCRREELANNTFDDFVDFFDDGASDDLDCFNAEGGTDDTVNVLTQGVPNEFGTLRAKEVLSGSRGPPSSVLRKRYPRFGSVVRP